MKNALAEHGREMQASIDAIRERGYFRYLIERGAMRRWGFDWQTPERVERLDLERAVIETADFQGSFIMLADVMEFCRREHIPYGPGRGSVGGSLVCYVLGIHEIDPLEYELLFERFMNPDRVSFPDVDIDISQRFRPRVLDYIVRKYNRDGQAVLRIGAFVRAGGRATVDNVATAMAQTDPSAWATATNLKKCFPPKGSITGGVKVSREIAYWLGAEKLAPIAAMADWTVDDALPEVGLGHGNKDTFLELAIQAGWLEDLLKLDGSMTHLGQHAAGVVILRQEDLPFIPTVTIRDTKDVETVATAYDMYSLDDLGYPKWDFLGLRTLDVIADADRFIGGTGETPDLMEIWREHRDHPDAYVAMCEGDTTGLFQVDTYGYQKTIRDFQPTCFDHLVQLGALYRPGALDYRDESGRNMVQVFIDRHHGRELATYDHPDLRPILGPTHGIILYQEQAMQIVRALAGFTRGEADSLRKAIGKKRPEELRKLKSLWDAGCGKRGIEEAVRDRIWLNIEAAGRYSWNKSHAVFYGVITWLTAWFKARHSEDLNDDVRRWSASTAAFYAAEINSQEGDKDKQANVVAQARQFATFAAPDINIAEDRFIVDGDSIVFGLNGIKGMGDANRNVILVERLMGGDFKSYADFCRRLPSVPVNMKIALVGCGAFDKLRADDNDLGPLERSTLLGTVTKPGPSGKRITAAEWINHYSKAKKPKPLPTDGEDIEDWQFPSDTELAAYEMAAMGYYISAVPLKAVTEGLARMTAGVIGGEVSKIKVKDDRNGNAMAHIDLTTPALTKRRLLIFSSLWPVLQSRVVEGAQLLFRGTDNDGAFLVDGAWAPDDVRHFKSIKVWRDGQKPKTESFDGRIETVRALEQAGYHVRML